MRRFQAFRLDTVNQCLWHGEARVELTPKAFGVLRYLVEHSGRLVTQEELLEALWPSTYVNPEILRKYVLEIRRVLGDRPEKPTFIETRPKRGYQFVASVVDEVPTEMLPAGGTKKIVGREPALSDLGGCLLRTQRSERQILFITGEPGIGKTALIDEFQRYLRADVSEICIVRGQCVEGYGGKEPYYPVLEAVAQLCRTSGGDFVQTLARQAPTWLVQFPALLKSEHRQTLQREIAGATPERMLREISEFLETIASEKPLLLILEDLHWADHATVDLISALARRRQPAKLILIGTYRPVDVVISSHPLKPLKHDLLIHHLCREIALQPLEEADVAEYVAAELGAAAVPEGLAGLIYRRSEGNPLFMVTVLEHIRERKLMTQEGNKVTFTLPLREIELCAPESLRQMIEIQLDRLSSEEHRALEAASVTGVLFPVVISAAAANMDADSFQDLCEGLSRRHQIVRPVDTQEFTSGTVSDRYEFVHALYRDVLYRRQPHGRRAQLHLLVGERLEALYAHQLSDAASALAHHFEQGREWTRAIKYLLIAADTAGRRFEPRRAVEILEHALELKNRLAEAERVQHEIMILERLATIHIAFVGVSPLLRKVWELVLANSEQHPEASQHAVELTAEFKDPLLRARTVIRWSLCSVLAGDWAGKHLEDCSRALELIRERANRLILGSNLLDYSLIQFFSSNYRVALQNAREGLAAVVQESENNPHLKEVSLHHFIVPWSLLFLGEWGEALHEIDRQAAMMDTSAHYAQARANRLYRAFVHSFAMDLAGVREICDSILPSLESPSDVRFCSMLLAQAELNMGNYERAHALLSATQEHMERLTVALDWYRRMLIESVLTELWLAKGDITQARLAGDRFLEIASATEERTWRALAWEASARVAMAELDQTRSQGCIAEALSTMKGFELPLADWRVHAAAFELCRKSGHRDLAERHLALSRQRIIKLADSLPAEEPLQRIFLSAPLVRKTLGDSEPPKLRVQNA
jgi:DNA-binding winged helix-turn-helix (wHTH) protein